MSFLLEDKSELQKPVKLPGNQEVKWIKNYYLKKLALVSPVDSTGIMKGIKD